MFMARAVDYTGYASTHGIDIFLSHRIQPPASTSRISKSNLVTS